MKKIAVIGSGISGVSSAYYLTKAGYDVTVLESRDYFGGHTNTHQVTVAEDTFPVDTGFLVHNDRTYPNLIGFFEELGIRTHSSEMSFSVDNRKDNISWAGSGVGAVFAQTKNIVNPLFWFFLYEILKFNKNADSYLKKASSDLSYTLGDLLKEHNYSDRFSFWYLLPMGACIWSSPVDEVLKFPAYTFLQFCKNHGLLQVTNRPQWKTIENGCETYTIKALGFVKNKFKNLPVLSVKKNHEGVVVKTKNGEELYDRCIFAAHAPDTLTILGGQFQNVESILSAFKYQENTAILHTDESILPRNKKVWSAWNYLLLKNAKNVSVSVSYLINMLQPLPVKKPVIVTLNPIKSINSDSVLKLLKYKHPLFNIEAIKQQSAIDDIQGLNSLYFCGAWQRYGFHEDGIWSAKRVVNKILEEDNLETLKIL